MLARSAAGLYWMGRYLRRVEHVSRLMEVQVDALVDQSLEQIHFGWLRLFSHLKVTNPSAVLESDFRNHEDWSFSDSFVLADDLTFNVDNPSSIVNSFLQGRENARQMRHCISAEMWLSLNRTYFRLKDLTIDSIWQRDPHLFYAEIVQHISTFIGVCAATLYRDERWEFLQIGRYIEHAQLMAALLIYQAQAATMENYEELDGYDWKSLLDCFQADQPYQNRHGVKVEPNHVMNMLVTDSILPNSIDHAVDQIRARLGELGRAPAQKSGALAQRFAGRLVSLLRYEWPDVEDKRRLLTLVESLAFKFHDHLSNAWFNYEIIDSSRM